MNLRAFYKLLICLICICGQDQASAQTTNNRLQISLLTCTPGSELYSTFGHSALRIIDSTQGTDIVYNYGTFDFNDNDFYVKFVRGKLLYYLSAEQLDVFKFDYQFENRGITEQVLNLSSAEKLEIYAAVKENIKEENKYYKYDFFLDNCTTRLRDLINQHKKPTPVLPAVMPVNYTFRNAIHHYLDLNEKHWSKLGIDMLLGAPCDGIMTVSQQEFLPDNLMIALDSTSNTSMIINRKEMYDYQKNIDKNSFLTPGLLFSLLLLLYLILGLFSNRVIQNLLYILDGILFFAVGALGILLVFMWTGTDHSMTKNNFNLLWAWPTNLLAAFLLFSKKEWAKVYLLIYAACLALLLCTWVLWPQQLNPALIPIVLLLMIRSVARRAY